MGSPPSAGIERVWIIGSAQQCDVVVNNPAVSAQHCRLVQFDDGYSLDDLGSTNGTWVNNMRLDAGTPVWVNPSDTITLGRQERMPWPADLTTAGRSNAAPGVWRRRITLGRGPQNDQVLDYPGVSWDHAALLQDAHGRWFVEDLNSTNGTSAGAIQNRIPPRQPVEVRTQDDIYLGSFKLNVSRATGGKRLTLGDASRETVALRGNSMVIGRDPSCDYPLDYPMISWRHAELARAADGIYVRDLGSQNGTYVNGVRIGGRTALKPGSEIGLGTFRFRLVDLDGNFARREYTGNVTIEAVALAVDIKKEGASQRLLEPVSLTIFPSELVAVMGPAGAGKTTFLKALNGYTVPSNGRVLFNGDDLYQFYDRFRLQLGYVPQDDIMHSLLTVQEALYFTARLRTDLTDDEIRARIHRVLTDLNIDDIGGRRIGSPENKVISGGQRKRVNIAMELLSDPNVLFLDEPTSGLSSYDAFQVIRLLRSLADSGKTVIFTIHQPSIDIFKEFDNLIMVSRDKGTQSTGALAYYGPAYPDSIKFFNPRAEATSAAQPGADLSPELLLDGLAQRNTGDWIQKYQVSPYRKEFVDSRAGQNPATAGVASGAVRKFGFGQWLTLVQRNLTLKLRDRSQVLFMLLQATLFPVLMVVVFKQLPDQTFSRLSDWTEFCGKISSIHFLMAIAAIWFGCNNAARDIVGEWAVFQRERMVSLKLPSYLFSKAALLAVIGLAQCTLLLGIVHIFAELKAPFLPTLLMLFLASQVGTALGLLISSFAASTESAIALLPIPLLFMILLGGGIKPLHEMSDVARGFSTVFPSRWAFEANLLLEAEERRGTSGSSVTQQSDCVGLHGELRDCASQLATARGRSVRIPSLPPPLRLDDVAEFSFPAKDRNSFELCAAILSGMVTALLGAVLAILRRRDLH